MGEMKDIFEEFAQTTTISGIFFIQKYKNICIKLMWLAVFILLAIMTLLQCYSSISTYYSWPTTVHTQV